MAAFHHRSVSSDGAEVTGILEAPDRASALKRLQAQSLFPVDLRQARRGALRNLLDIEIGGGQRTSDREAGTMAARLGALLQAGLPLASSLDLLSKDRPGRRADNRYAPLAEAVKSGASLSEALERTDADGHAFLVSMVRAGEHSGDLGEALNRAGAFLARSAKAKSDLRAAMIYPAFLIVAGIASMLVMLTFVVPTFRPLFESAGKQPPFLTELVLDLSRWVESYWWLMLALLLVAVLLLRLANYNRGISQWRDAVYLRFPVLGPLLVHLNVGRYCETLGTLVGSGVPLTRACTLAASVVGNRALSGPLAQLAEDLGRGRSFSGALDGIRAFPGATAQLAKIGESTGQLDKLMLGAAEHHEGEASQMLARLMASLVPTIILVLGLLIAVFVASILVALINMNELVLA